MFKNTLKINKIKVTHLNSPMSESRVEPEKLYFRVSKKIRALVTNRTLRAVAVASIYIRERRSNGCVVLKL